MKCCSFISEMKDHQIMYPLISICHFVGNKAQRVLSFALCACSYLVMYLGCYRRAPFYRGLQISWKEQKHFCRGNYFRGLTFSAQAATYMIMINSCICVIFRWNNFHVKQKICEILENCGPRKKVPYGILCTIGMMNSFIIHMFKWPSCQWVLLHYGNYKLSAFLERQLSTIAM